MSRRRRVTDLDTSDSEETVENSDSDESCKNFGSTKASPTGTGKALRLISFERSADLDESLKIEVDIHVLDGVLKTCRNKPICLISICGERRCGKSLVCNYIKDYLATIEDDEEETWTPPKKTVSGFEWKPGYKQQTLGIWVWSEAFFVNVDDKVVAVLLLDTQGITECTLQDEITAIIGIALTLSSITILNFVNEIPDEVFQWLSTFVKYGSLTAKMGISYPFQTLSFLIRDWSHLLEYSWGQKSGEKYLKQILKNHCEEGKMIKKVFEKLDCFLMPFIGSNALAKTFSGNARDLDQEFSKRLEMYMIGVLERENLQPKTLWGTEITPEILRVLLLTYVHLFNDKAKTRHALTPELLLKTNLELFEKTKVTAALDAYKSVYLERLHAGGSTLLRDESIDAMHEQACEKARQAFKRFQLPKHEESRMQVKLEKLLEKENERLKTENKGSRRHQITENVRITGDRFRNKLAERFTFSPEAGKSENMVFYENHVLIRECAAMMDATKQEFLESFDAVDENERKVLEDTIHSVLEPMVDAYVNKNLQNLGNAETFAQISVSDLKKEYSTSMSQKLKILPNMEADTLKYMHDEMVQKIEKKFRQLNLGTESFQQEWVADIHQFMNAEHQKMLYGLDKTISNVQQMIQREVSEYRKTLRQKAEEFDEEIQLRNYHDTAIIAIITNFSTTCPIPQNTPQGNSLYQDLNNLLDSTYNQVVEEGVVEKQRQKERLQVEFTSRLEEYNQAMVKALNCNSFLKESKFRSVSAEAKNMALASFASLFSSFPGYFESNSKLEAELQRKETSWANENEQSKQEAISNADTIAVSLLESYNVKMMAAVTKTESIEELIMEHSKLLAEIETEFTERCGCRNQTFLKTRLVSVANSAEEAFDGVKKHFDLVKQTEDINLKATLFAVAACYKENMDKHFNNKNGYFTLNELIEIHEIAKTTAIQRVGPDGNCFVQQVQNEMEEMFQSFKDKNELIIKSFEDIEPAIGIDLGTTYCCVAVFLHGKLKTVRNAHSGQIIPSYVQFGKYGNKIFGTPAKEQAYESPEATIFDAKRIIGRRWEDPHLQDDMKFWPFAVVNNDGPKIEVQKQLYYPEQISSFLLEHLKNEAQNTLDIEIKKAVITVPAYFTDGQRQATLYAGELAGLEVLKILNEPTAAAVAYHQDYLYSDNKRKVLVFDLGGGTFDVAILEMSKTQISVLSIGGDAHLGGEDFDKNMMTYCAQQFLAKTKIDLFRDKDSQAKQKRDDCRRRLRRLQTMCEQGKKALSAARSKIITLDAFVGNEDLTVEVTQKKFEELNMPLFQKTILIVDDTLASANLQKEEIDDIVLVGGSTIIPKLQEMLSKHFGGKALNKRIDPDQAVAHGAALQAAMLCANQNKRLFDFNLIQDVTPMSLGIEMANKYFDEIIPRNTKIPTTLEQDYLTRQDDQTSAAIKIYQGEEQIAADNKLLGTFTLSGIPRAKAGEEKVKVIMHINANGILSVEGVCRNGSRKVTVNQEKGIMTEETKQRIIAQDDPQIPD